MPDPGSELPHIIVRDTARPQRYTAVGGGGREFLLKVRERSPHAQKIQTQLETARREAAALDAERAVIGLHGDFGIVLEFESDPGYPLKIESLGRASTGIEVLNVRQQLLEGPEGAPLIATFATVFVPHGKLDLFFRIIERYRQSLLQHPDNPRHKELVESIENLRMASLRAFWTETGMPFPGNDSLVWWEVWLRVGGTPGERAEILEGFRRHARSANIEVRPNALFFPEETVVLAQATADQLTHSVFLLNCIAELRAPKNTPVAFTEMPRIEQAEWVEDALRRITEAPKDSPAVCLLDTGVNNSHPLIARGLDDDDMHAYNPAWARTDHAGHGTEMAGIGLYGDLFHILTGAETIALRHRLESVKMLPPAGGNDPELYGEITKECVARPEVTAPERRRAICCTVTTTDFRDRGQPSSWSAAIDQLCSGADEDGQIRRLLFVSAGNTDWTHFPSYPDSNETEGIHDPGQSWNAVTVGAFTEKYRIEEPDRGDWQPLAPAGDLCPSSTTSLIWHRQWPLKPDVVYEGGNMAKEPITNTVDFVDSLLLLSTFWRPQDRLLVTTGQTSAAAALAARDAAIIFSYYPNYWAETVRGLIVHSARWTRRMMGNRDPWTLSRQELRTLLRKFGMGVPNLGRALSSARNSLTLIAQDSLQPYRQDGSEIKTCDLNIHHLPWPREQLLALGETPVTMRVTLSYFIEPNPGRRGWNRKYRYASHGLRFEAKRPTETVADFEARINRVAREENEDYTPTSSDSTNWMLGSDLRSAGSIHRDSWHGTAAELAEKGFIAVFPINGWWRERKQHQKWNRRAQYSLIVTIMTPSVEMDVYTPIANIVMV